MKNHLYSFIILFGFSFMSFAQSNFINYQGVASDASGNAIVSTAINIQIALKFGTPTATASYIETHNPTTDANGLFNIKIGNGTLVSGVYDSSDFGTDASYITVSLNGAVMGTTELNAVPYALSSGDSYWELNGNRLKSKFQRDVSLQADLSAFTITAENFAGSTGTGYGITEFSNDPFLTLGVNQGAFTVSTQQAVKTYVDNSIGALNIVSSIDDLSDGKTFPNQVFLGRRAGESITTGSQNVAVGTIAMQNTTTGQFNVAVGNQALTANTVGIGNTAVGNGALTSNTSGDSNTALGSITLSNNTTGVENTAIGRRALQNINTGSGNVALGFEAGKNETGSNKLYIANSSTSIPLIYGEFDNDLVTVNGTLTLKNTVFNGTAPDLILSGRGNTAAADDGIISSDPSFAGSDIFLRSNDAVVIELDYDDNETGQFEIKNGAGNLVFDVYESGNATLAGTLNQNSDRRLKKDIEILPYGLDEVLKLEPKFYNWKNREEEHKSLGLIAQEVQEVIKEIVTAKEDEQKTLSVSYIELIPVLVNAIKEQQEQIEGLQATNKTKDEALAQVLERLNSLEKKIQLDSNKEDDLVVKH
jgi:hypothetical protein